VSRELDAQIAEKVMGLQVGIAGMAFYNPEERFRVYDPETKTLGECLPFYSKSIASVWEVVEKLRERKMPLSIVQVLHMTDEPYWEYLAKVEWIDDLKGYQYEFATSKSAPEAICNAVMAAINAHSSRGVRGEERG
jgi:hypothetical protein